MILLFLGAVLRHLSTHYPYFITICTMMDGGSNFARMSCTICGTYDAALLCLSSFCRRWEKKERCLFFICLFLYKIYIFWLSELGNPYFDSLCAIPLLSIDFIYTVLILVLRFMNKYKYTPYWIFRLMKSAQNRKYCCISLNLKADKYQSREYNRRTRTDDHRNLRLKVSKLWVDKVLIK